MKSIKNNHKGSAMTLVIIAMALLSIFMLSISNQLINKMKNTNKNYQDIKSKYIAEAGIERTTSEVYKQIVNEINNNDTINNVRANGLSKKIDHSGHDFMIFDENGTPTVNSFRESIILDLMHANNPNFNDGIGYTYQSIITNFEWYVKQVINYEDFEDLKTNYCDRIYNLIETNIYNNGSLDWSKYNVELLKNELNIFISKLNQIENNIVSSSNSQTSKTNAIEYIDKMKNIMTEIQCRLKFNISTGSTAETTEKRVQIKIPIYRVYETNDGELNFEDIGINKTADIKVVNQLGKVVSVDFSDINNQRIVSEGSIEKDGKLYKLEADIDFELIKNERNDYEVVQNIKSYKKIN